MACTSSAGWAKKPRNADAADRGLEIISYQTIEAHLSFLAGDALEGREAGSRGGRVAAEYVQAVLKELGVAPFYGAYLQEFEALSPVREKQANFEVHPDSIAKYRQAASYRRLSLQNVIGYVEGERKDEFTVIGAHYDHVGVDPLLEGDKIYNGADDNAAGVASLLQVAKAVKASGKKPLRSIIFAFWDGEEVNYLGSEYFVQDFEETSRIKAYINLDMISREGLLPVLYPKFSIPAATEENTAKGNQLHLAYTKDYSPASEELLRSIDRHHLNIEPKPVVIEHGSRGSDYLPFSLRKVPVLWFFTGLHPDYHTPDDEVDRVDFDKLVEITKAVYLSLHTEWAP
jgi:Zn-dependent M28 family amino/carboxypeptidase